MSGAQGSLIKTSFPTKFVYQPIFSSIDDDENSLSELPFTAYTISTAVDPEDENIQPTMDNTATLTNLTVKKSEDCSQCRMVPQIQIPNEEELRLLSPQHRPKTSNSGQNSRRTCERTPNTLLKMMERHRESERVRHHTLNELMRRVCDTVPGYSDALKETKVVMMQRIISYICYLENTITKVCDQLNVKASSLQMSTDFLTDQWKPEKCNQTKFKRNEANMTTIKYKVREKAAKKRVDELERRRLKISSPTIDSTTDDCGETPYLLQEESEVYQPLERIEPSHDIGIKTDFHHSEKEMDKENNDNDFFVPEQFADTPTKYFNNDIIPTSSNLDNFPDPFDLMSSPVGMKYPGMLSPRVDHANFSFGIRSDKRDLNETLEMGENEMRTVSPECVLQTVNSQEDKLVVTQSLHQTTTTLSSISSPGKLIWAAPGHTVSQTPVKSPVLTGRNKRKQYTPVRSPFHDITNYMCSPDKEERYMSVPLEEPRPKRVKLDSELTLGKFARESPVDGDFVSYVPYIWKFHSCKFTKRQKAERPECDSMSFNTNVTQSDNALSKPEKVDHRKTTWMNGFMMFSRLNRRTFISANPGVHTSQISKMMGHAWRNMPPEEQQPYKEKARECASRLRSSSPVIDSNEASNDSEGPDLEQVKEHDSPLNDRKVPSLLEEVLDSE